MGDDEPDDEFDVRPSRRWRRRIREQADQLVSGPATLLLLSGVLNVAVSGFALIVVAAERWQWRSGGTRTGAADASPEFVLWGMGSLGVGLAIGAGAYRMAHLRGPWWHAVAVSVLALLPWMGCWCVFAPIALWSLAVLCLPTVRLAYSLGPGGP